MNGFIVEKVLNNNVVIATHSSYGEVVSIGKGIGFNRKKGEELSPDLAEKTFVLKNVKEQESYKKLLPKIDQNLQAAIIESIHLINNRVSGKLNEHIHVGLTDHLLFALQRVSQGMTIKNPFLKETITLYPFEHDIAVDVIDLIEDKTGIGLPQGEIGFITLHIHSAIANKDLSEVNQHSQLIYHLIQVVEEQLEVQINKDSVDYTRLVRHLRFMIDRVMAGEEVDEPEKIALLLKEEYPLCYNISWKLIKIMQQKLGKPVFDAEAVYLTMHIQRLQKKIK
ncbi:MULTISPECIES: glucose PTS transporter transcription antiterminator GlcT [Peribacillus]|uniref:glucose PTS transporter transcription antiterminator GlcT n=1 Tax=Peribacillus TaxID=2675229 RepID=UPI001914941E|nr:MULTISPECIES: transcription antiterminator [unclassified Peribacillus]MBK5444587.1 transcription antiterminator [Peribacillus sp. TH24]MBK5460707.1 transcription antiterminator [Peribacillus sp. TH27]MBK5485975.1 transcription antiterminator [Peribacillus sp. TH16]MBK5498855.1 transcription antiterminator [Peribacillus sp. TH14]WMX56040.1 transcription antiterminator [Peribacillus sp. R9-11]